MKYYSLMVFLVVLSISCHKNIISKDLPKDKRYPAFNEELIFTIAGDSIAGYAFIAAGSDLKETIILVHGYPGNDNNFDLAQALRRAGKNVIHFHFRGAWGNQGQYLYSHGLEDIDFLIEYLTTAENAARLRIEKNNFTLLGRSYGGGIALIKGSTNHHVNKIIAIAAVNYGAIMEKYQSLNELGKFKRYMKKQFMINTNIDAFLQEMLDKKKAFNILSYKNQLKNKKVLIIEDSAKNDSWISQIENSSVIKFDTDHNFIDKRLEMITTIVNWLNGRKI